MIKSDLYKRAFDQATQLADRGIYLQPRDGSALSALVSECSDISYAFGTAKPLDVFIAPNNHAYGSTVADKPLDEMANLVENQTSVYNTFNKHSSMVLTMVEELKPYVLSHISTAKNTIAPIFSDFHEKLKQALDRMKAIDPAAEFTIDQGNFPVFLLDETFRAYGLEQYSANAEISEPETVLSFKELDETQLKTAVLVSNQRLDIEIQKWLAGFSPEFVRRVFVANFSRTGDYAETRDYVLKKYSVAGMNPYDALAIATVYYLLAVNFRATPVEVVNSVTSAAYDDVLKQMEIFSATIILKQLERLKQSFSSKILVVEFNLEKKRIVVNREIYQDYLKQGGQPEALLGMLVTSIRVYGASAILEKSEAYAQLWQTFVTGSAYRNEIQLKENFINYIESDIALALSNPTEFEAEYFSKNPNAKALIMAKVREEITHLNHRLLEDLEHTALHIIARGRFYYTPAYEILNEMINIAKKNPESDAREAAHLATAKYIVQYLLLQVTGQK